MNAYTNDEIMDAFHRIMQESNSNLKVNRDGLMKLTSVHSDISALLSGRAEIKLHPVFDAGDVSIEVESVELSGEEVLKFKSILEQCDTFAVVPVGNGKIKASVTLKRIFDYDD